MIGYSFRLCTLKENAALDIKNIMDAFKSKIGVWSFELGQKTEQPHIHGYFETEKEFPQSLAGDRQRQRFINTLGYKGNKKYSCTVTEDKEKYLIYIVKDGDIIFNEGIDLEEYKAKSLKINENKKMNTTDKILFFPQEHKLPTDTLYLCQLLVVKFYMSIGGVVRNKGLLLYFANYVFQKNNLKSADELLSIIYGIEPDKAQKMKNV
jgi:hypothetical protein